MTVSIPELDGDLARLLEEASDIRKYRKYEHDEWKNTLLPQIKQRLHAIVQICTSQGEQISGQTEAVDLQSAIKGVYQRINQHIDDNFAQNPPFTLPRLAELILNPQKEGYDLSSNVSVIKFFNALAKTVLVSSAVTDFPPIEWSDPQKQSVVSSPLRSSQTAVSVPLVEIPWLKDEGSKKKLPEEQNDAITSESIGTETIGNIPHIPPPEAEVPQSPRRRRDQDSEDHPRDESESAGSKKAKTEGNNSPTTPSWLQSEDEEIDKMDLSNNEEVLTSPNPPEVPTEESPIVRQGKTDDVDMEEIRKE